MCHIELKMTANYLSETGLIPIKWWLAKQREPMPTIQSCLDGIHSAELKRCQRELLQASSWAEAFGQHADKLQAKLSSMLKDKTPVLLGSPIPTKVDPIQESIDAKESAPMNNPCLHLLLGSTAGSRFSPGHLTVKEREIIQCQCQFTTLPKLPLIGKNAS